MAFALPRAEVVQAVRTRVGLLEDYLVVLATQIEQILEAKDTPDTATEVPRLISARTRGELEWARDYLDRLAAGAYAFQDEPPLVDADARADRDRARRRGRAGRGHRHGRGETRNSQG